MDSYFRECHREVHFVSTPTVSIETVTPLLPDQFQATFNFSCQQKYRNWILRQDSTELEFLDGVEAPLVTKSIRYNPEKTTHSKIFMHRRVFRVLKDFSLPYSKCFELAKVLSDIIVDYMPQGGNSLKIDFSFVVVHKHIFDENLAIDLVTQQSMQEELEPAMVPAADASIKSLKSKVIDSSDENHGSCRVCLEDFEAGCEQVAMPCSHIFHKDCIEKWLKASHYCPICRYEMPIN